MPYLAGKASAEEKAIDLDIADRVLGVRHSPHGQGQNLMGAAQFQG
jgi:hypothetical protein